MPQQDVGALQQFTQPLQQLTVEHAVQRQLCFQAQREVFTQLAHDPAQRLRPERQVIDIEGRSGGEDPEALAEQLQGGGRALGFAADDVHQHDVAVHVGVVDQGQRGGRNRYLGRDDALGVARAAQAGQAHRHRLQEAWAELRVDLMQLAGLRENVGLDLAVARALGVAEQLALELHDGQLEWRGEGLHRQPVQRGQQAAHARRRGHVRKAGHVGLGRRRCGRRHPMFFQLP
ncbi:hypothetical protein D3C71_1389910 [compost metagenome]